SRGDLAMSGLPAALPDRVARAEASRAAPGPVWVLGHDRVGHADAASLDMHVLRHDVFCEEDGCRATGTFTTRRQRRWRGYHWTGAEAGSLDDPMTMKRLGWLRS